MLASSNELESFLFPFDSFKMKDSILIDRGIILKSNIVQLLLWCIFPSQRTFHTNWVIWAFQQPCEESWVDKDIINFILNMETQGEEMITYPKTYIS